MRRVILHDFFDLTDYCCDNALSLTILFEELTNISGLIDPLLLYSGQGFMTYSIESTY